MDAKAKKIELYLYNGTLDGMTYVSESVGWDLGGILYSCPRNSTDILLNDDSCDKYGVYLLISSDKVYIGQSTELRQRIKQHILHKNWWEKVILLTSKNDELNESYITYLESSLIAKAMKCKTLDCENKTKGNKCNLDKFTKKLLDQYLEEALFILELIGVKVFTEDNKKSLIESIPVNTEEEIQIREKNEAIKFLNDKGIKLSDYISYSKCNNKKKTYWLNPKVNAVQMDWDVILNDQSNNVLYLLRIPANTLKASLNKGNNLLIRKDRQAYIDLNIDTNTFVDKRSKISFVNFIEEKITY